LPAQQKWDEIKDDIFISPAWSPLHVIRERVRVRVIFDLPKPFGQSENPHPGPLPEYMERGEFMYCPRQNLFA
jgi:hypothetical protein